MPLLYSESDLEAHAEGLSVSLRVRYEFMTESLTTQSGFLDEKILQKFDILSRSDLEVSFEILFDGKRVSCEEVLHSPMTDHSVKLIRSNATNLGLRNISELFVDELNNIPKIKLAPGGSLNKWPGLSVLRLSSIALTFDWNTPRPDVLEEGSNLSLNSQKLLLPVESALNELLDKFLRTELIGRCPLIFGPSRSIIEREASYLPPLIQGTLRIYKRSNNPKFREECALLLAMIKKTMEAKSELLVQDLENFKIVKLCPQKAAIMTDEEVLHGALEEILTHSNLIHSSKTGSRKNGLHKQIPNIGIEDHQSAKSYGPLESSPKLMPEIDDRDMLNCVDVGCDSIDAKPKESEHELWSSEFEDPFYIPQLGDPRVAQEILEELLSESATDLQDEMTQAQLCDENQGMDCLGIGDLDDNYPTGFEDRSLPREGDTKEDMHMDDFSEIQDQILWLD